MADVTDRAFSWITVSPLCARTHNPSLCRGWKDKSRLGLLDDESFQPTTVYAAAAAAAECDVEKFDHSMLASLL